MNGFAGPWITPILGFRSIRARSDGLAVPPACFSHRSCCVPDRCRLSPLSIGRRSLPPLLLCTARSKLSDEAVLPFLLTDCVFFKPASGSVLVISSTFRLDHESCCAYSGCNNDVFVSVVMSHFIIRHAFMLSGISMKVLMSDLLMAQMKEQSGGCNDISCKCPSMR